MQHTARGAPKIMKKCSLPVTSLRPVDLVVTEMAVIGFRGTAADQSCSKPLREEIPAAEVVAATAADLLIPSNVPEMQL